MKETRTKKHVHSCWEYLPEITTSHWLELTTCIHLAIRVSRKYGVSLSCLVKIRVILLRMKLRVAIEGQLAVSAIGSYLNMKSVLYFLHRTCKWPNSSQCQRLTSRTCVKMRILICWTWSHYALSLKLMGPPIRIWEKGQPTAKVWTW